MKKKHNFAAIYCNNKTIYTMRIKLHHISVSIIILMLMSGLYGQNRITVTLQDFTSLSVSGRADVEILPSDSHKMSITARDGRPEEVEYEIRKGELKIRTKPDLKKENEIAIRIPYSVLSSIEASAGAVINSREELKSKDLNLKAIAGGKIELTVETAMIDAKSTQGSDIILYGTTQYQNVLANTGGNYLAYELESEEAIVKASSGSQIKVKASKKLNATASSKGFVGYVGDPETLQIQTSLGGIIERNKHIPEEN